MVGRSSDVALPGPVVFALFLLFIPINLVIKAVDGMVDAVRSRRAPHH